MDLTSDSKFLIVIPQHYLYYVPNEDSKGSASDDEDGDLANTTISTVDSRPSTQAEGSAEGAIPDFAIIRVSCRFRNCVLRRNYLNVKIRYAGVPIIIEVKRGGSRSLDGVDFLKSTRVKIERGEDDLYRQAAYMFTMHQRQKYVVLVACSGVYWCCRRIDRQTVMYRVAKLPTDDFQPDMDEGFDLDEDEDEDDHGIELGDVSWEDDIDLISQRDGLSVGQRAIGCTQHLIYIRGRFSGTCGGRARPCIARG